jgi:glycosyltransferase involved in cell wall biosynthesis
MINFIQNYKNLVFVSKYVIQNPTISFIITSHNRLDLIIESLNSILNQEKHSLQYEIIIIDSSQSINLINSLILFVEKRCVMNLKIFRNINFDLADKFNEASKISSGIWLSFLHDDDILNLNYISNVEFLIRHYNFDGLTSNTIHFRNSATLIKNYDHRKKIKYRISYYDSMILNSNPYGEPSCGFLFKKAILIHSNGFNAKFYPISDWIFLLKMSKSHIILKPKFITGYYRIAVNDSINPHTQSKFFYWFNKMGFVFYRQSYFWRIYYLIFRKSINKLHLQSFNRLNSKVFIKSKKVYNLNFILFLLIIKIYFFSKRIFFYNRRYLKNE